MNKLLQPFQATLLPACPGAHTVRKNQRAISWVIMGRASLLPAVRMPPSISDSETPVAWTLSWGFLTGHTKKKQQLLLPQFHPPTGIPEVEVPPRARLWCWALCSPGGQEQREFLQSMQLASWMEDKWNIHWALTAHRYLAHFNIISLNPHSKCE